MANLSFTVDRVSAELDAACPTLNFQIRAEQKSLEKIQAVVLESRIFVEPRAQPLSRGALDRLEDLFGESSQWATSNRPLTWARASAILPAFSGSARFDLEVPCSFDFNVASTKFFYGLEAPSAMLRFDFSGTIFVDRQAVALPAGLQSRFELPVAIWSDLMDAYYPHSMWLRLPRNVFHRMNQYRMENQIPTWEDVLERLLPSGQEAVH